MRRVLLAIVLLALNACRATPTHRPAAATSTTAAATSSTQPATLSSVTSTSVRSFSAGLAGKVIAIDPGHNGGNASRPVEINHLVDAVTLRKPCDTAGAATASGYTESEFNLDIGLRLRRLLEAAGATVVLTRNDNRGVGPCITERAAIGNRAHADVAISIHADGGPPSGRGFHVIEPVLIAHHTEAIVGPSRRLAQDVRNAVAARAGIPSATYVGHNGIADRNDLGGLNLSTVPKVFLECGNLRNTIDAALLESPAVRERIALALTDALTQFLLGR